MIRNAILLLSLLVTAPLVAGGQTAVSESLGACTLKNYVYSCDSAAFSKTLASAKSAAVETQNVDAYAREQLKNMITKRYGKALADQGSAPELIFLITPVGVDGINISPGEPTLGTLRVYSATPEGGRDHLLWAETYSGTQDLPWPAVVHSLVNQFQKHFPAR